jgi:hypothetical protein
VLHLDPRAWPALISPPTRRVTRLRPTHPATPPGLHQLVHQQLPTAVDILGPESEDEANPEQIAGTGGALLALRQMVTWSAATFLRGRSVSTSWCRPQGRLSASRCDQCRGVSGLVIMSRMRWACRFPGWGQCGRRLSGCKVVCPRFAAGAGPCSAPRRRLRR